MIIILISPAAWFVNQRFSASISPCLQSRAILSSQLSAPSGSTPLAWAARYKQQTPDLLSRWIIRRIRGSTLFSGAAVQ
jgi:hypothetical protein